MTEFGNLRFWYLHELRRLRAVARTGGNVTKERRDIQRKMVGLRASNLKREYA